MKTDDSKKIMVIDHWKPGVASTIIEKLKTMEVERYGETSHVDVVKENNVNKLGAVMGALEANGIMTPFGKGSKKKKKRDDPKYIQQQRIEAAEEKRQRKAENRKRQAGLK